MSRSCWESREDAGNDALEQLVADIMVAVLSLEYGAVMVSVKNGQVVQVERHEKRRLVKSLPTFQRSCEHYPSPPLTHLSSNPQ